MRYFGLVVPGGGMVSGIAGEYYDQLPQKKCYAKADESQSDRFGIRYVVPIRCNRVVY